MVYNGAPVVSELQWCLRSVKGEVSDFWYKLVLSYLFLLQVLMPACPDWLDVKNKWPTFVFPPLTLPTFTWTAII